MTIQKHQFAPALLLLAVSLFALRPPSTVADQQHAAGTININATGQATPIKKGKGQVPTSATLILTGSAHTEGNGEVKINDLTGSLQIGTSYFAFAILDGHGEMNKHGEVEINAKASDGNHKFELELHGNIQGNNIVFNSPESKLSSLYFLSLSGQATLSITTSTTSTSTTTSKSESETETSQEED